MKTALKLISLSFLLFNTNLHAQEVEMRIEVNGQEWQGDTLYTDTVTSLLFVLPTIEEFQLYDQLTIVKDYSSKNGPQNRIVFDIDMEDILFSEDRKEITFNMVKWGTRGCDYDYCIGTRSLFDSQLTEPDKMFINISMQKRIGEKLKTNSDGSTYIVPVYGKSKNVAGSSVILKPSKEVVTANKKKKRKAIIIGGAAVVTGLLLWNFVF